MNRTGHLNQLNYFRKKNLRIALLIIVLLVFTYGASIFSEYNHIAGFKTIPLAAVWMVQHMFFSASTLEHLPKVLKVLWETIILSVIATTTASVFACLFAMLGSKATQVHPVLAVIARMIASVFRNIPIVAWALVLVISFGQNAVTGYLALFFATFGFLVRAFIETIDESSKDTVEALTATGATYFQIVSKAVIPESLPQMLSWILFMIETNIRSSTLIGILTGSGIGYLFDMYYKRMDYEMITLITLSIVITVIVIELISNALRREML
ncbi:PhnE/PtxC family ABC transporter permease [Macrococcus capreoli]|uniref:PhnE/PtxC family ABC transporter permease n=1 Tax=Macrococcus capreoli TaxID=2982690 RepID=UPI0021D5754D|nr:ABC transporter permease subunit [Macrococcus sp. TMW 2.2395]MCU7556143.1 ABC transporter permease subunit [Macrococcus sp. TMW 2.2395]